MAGNVQKKLVDLGIKLPELSKPSAIYVPFVKVGHLVFVSGQGPREDGVVKYVGKVGTDFSLEEGNKAARLCGLNLLSHLREACDGDLDLVKRVVRLAEIVNCVPEFTQHPKVIDGASALFHEIFGEAGKHARIATGTSSLPNGMAVEVEGIFEVA